MQVGAPSTAAVALQLLSHTQSAVTPALATAKQAASVSLLTGDTYGRTTSAAIAAIQELASSGTSASAQTKAIETVREWAKSGAYANAAKGIVDDQLRATVRDGKLPDLPQLDDAQWNSLSETEKSIYGTVRTLQGLYEAQPKSLEQALSDHVKIVTESYPDSIARMKEGLATGTLQAKDGWNDVIAQYQAQLDAAQQGKMQIQTVNDHKLIQSANEPSVSHNAFGWSGEGSSVNADIPALKTALGAGNVLPGTSAYFGDYAITW